MAKTTRHGGASHEETPVRIKRAMLGGEPKSVGISSTQSSKSESPPSDKEKPSPRKRAHTTGNPSKRRGKGTVSSVDSTGGNGPKTEQPPSGKANVRSTDDVDNPEFFDE